MLKPGWDGPVAHGWRFDFKVIQTAFQRFAPQGNTPGRSMTLRKALSLFHARWRPLKKPLIGFEGDVKVPYARVQDEGDGPREIVPVGYFAADELEATDGVDTPKRAGKALRFIGKSGEVVFRKKVTRGPIPATNYTGKAIDALVAERGHEALKGLKVGWVDANVGSTGRAA